MSVKAKLIIDDMEVNILWFTFGFNQGADISGRPSQRPRFVGLKLIIETRKDLNLAEWSFSPNEKKQIELHIYPIIMGGKTRKLYFYDCHLVSWKNDFTATGSNPMSETLDITCAGVDDSTSAGVYSAYWRETFKKDNVEATILEEIEPKLVEYHFENKNGEVIEEKDIKGNQEIELVITTENANGTTIKVNLNNSRLDFKHNGEILENDILKGVKINDEETRVPLTAIKQ